MKTGIDEESQNFCTAKAADRCFGDKKVPGFDRLVTLHVIGNMTTKSLGKSPIYSTAIFFP